MVQVKTAGYGMTKNLGNYENYRVYLEGNLDEGESYLDAIATLKAMCESDLKGYDIKSYEKMIKGLKNEMEVLNKRLKKLFILERECYDEMGKLIDEGKLDVAQIAKMREFSELMSMKFKTANAEDLDNIPF